jgi:phosphohistidine phosphatase
LDLNSPISSQNDPSCTVVLVHHGRALGRDVEPTQPLSGPGRAASQRLAVEVAARGVKPDIIWHSGKFRARQTAELFWRVCNPGAAFSVSRGLQPTDPPRVIRDQLEAGDRAILLVGHMPHLAGLLRVLCGELHDGPGMAFPEHGCVALVRQAGRWEELWRLDAPSADLL